MVWLLWALLRAAIDCPSFKVTIYSGPPDSAREWTRTKAKMQTAPSSRTLMTLPLDRCSRDDSPHPRLLIRQATNHESAILQRDCQIKGAVGNSLKRELA